MLTKKLSDITIEDVYNLIEDEVCENKFLDYKSALNLETPDERKEFLADITAFANADGGDIVFGIKEDSDTKLPVELVGIDIQSTDDLILRIGNMLRDSVEPRIPSWEYNLFPLENGKHILIIRAGLSYLSPHRVLSGKGDRFFIRNTNGKHPMDVGELRSSFTMSQTLFKEIDNYIEESLITIAQNRNRELLEEIPIFVLQFMPLSTFRYDRPLYSVKEVDACITATPHHQHRITIDGVVEAYKGDSVHNPYLSSRIYYKTNGIVEFSTTGFFQPQFKDSNRSPSEPEDIVWSPTLLDDSISRTEKTKKYYGRLGVNAPILLSCSILRGKGYSLSTSRRRHGAAKIDRDVVTVPPVTINELEQTTTEMLRPIFDSIWNAFGYFHCSAYEEGTGNYVGLR